MKWSNIFFSNDWCITCNQYLSRGNWLIVVLGVECDGPCHVRPFIEWSYVAWLVRLWPTLCPVYIVQWPAPRLGIHYQCFGLLYCQIYPITHIFKCTSVAKYHASTTTPNSLSCSIQFNIKKPFNNINIDCRCQQNHQHTTTCILWNWMWWTQQIRHSNDRTFQKIFLTHRFSYKSSCCNWYN